MKLFEEFKMWEHMWDTLHESKADTKQLIDFAGEDLAKRFLAIRHRFKTPENDLYYWIKNKTVGELEIAVSALENSKSNTAVKKELAQGGAKLVGENESWMVYHITSYEAAQVYGRDTKWCITGINDEGDLYWKDYHDVRGVEFYFYISKQNYTSRGNNSKYALAIWPKKKAYEIYDQQDNLVTIRQVPFIKELSIPGIDFTKLRPYKLPTSPKCKHCGLDIYICDGDDDYTMTDNDTKFYHTFCWYEKFKPDKVKDLTELFIKGPGVARVYITEPYQKALTRIINAVSSLNHQQKKSLILDWTTINPYKSLVSIRDGKIDINDASAGEQIKQIFEN